MQMSFPFVPAFAESKGSAIREMVKWAADPGVISFAGGYPATDAFDLEGLRRASQAAWDRDPGACLQYGTTEGVESLRQAIQHLNRARGIAADDKRLMIATGSQQALDLLLRATVSPGDTVLVERPTYPGALQAFRLAGAHVLDIEGDALGPDPHAVERILTACASKPKLIYLVPTFANPTGSTMSMDRRRAFLRLAAEHGILLVEDDPYGMLRFSGEPIAPMAALACADERLRETSVYLSTLSKVAVPALRIGWMVASPEVVRRCVMAKQVSDMCTSPWMQQVGAAYLQSPDFEAHVPRIIDVYRERADAMVQALHAAFGQEWAFRAPEGGMFLWVRLPRGVDASDLVQDALAEKVLFIPGAACHANDPDPATLRISYSSVAPDRIPEGVARLKRAYQAYCSR